MNDSSNTVKFRERIYLRVNKESDLQIKHVKKQITSKSTDLLSTTLLQLVDDLFAEGFVDECLERLEKHPETLYTNMDNKHTVTPENIQNTLYNKEDMQLQIYDVSKMKEQADQGTFIRQDSLHKFNSLVSKSKDNLHEEKMFQEFEDVKEKESDPMRDTKMSFKSILRDDTINIYENFMLDEEVQDVCLNVYESVM